MLREFAFFAVRNLCKNNMENQRAINALQPQAGIHGGKIVQDGDEVAPGITAKVGKDGKVELTKSDGSNPW